MSAIGVSIRTSLVLLGFTLAFTLLMAAAYDATKGTIAASAEQEKMKLMNEVLAPAEYDNALLSDYVELPAAAALGSSAPSRLYRARRQGEPVALLFEAVAPDGYSGRIRLLLAMRADGRIAAVRVTEHKETPGLGDYIDIRKDKNKARPWITQFNQTGLDTVPVQRWKVKKDGGTFDQVTGATITARAVTNAVGRALPYVLEHREKLFAAPSGSKLEG